MKNKLPVVGQRYKCREEQISSRFESGIVRTVDEDFITYELFGCLGFGVMIFCSVDRFCQIFEEPPSASKENHTCSLEVKEALEKLKMWLEAANTDLIDKNSDIWQLFKAGQNLINALESKENK
jgi:hypothetical protein